MYNDFDTLNYSTTYTLLVNARGSEIKPFISEQPCKSKFVNQFWIGIYLDQIQTLSILKGSLMELVQNQTYIFHLDYSK